MIMKISIQNLAGERNYFKMVFNLAFEVTSYPEVFSISASKLYIATAYLSRFDPIMSDLSFKEYSP